MAKCTHQLEMRYFAGIIRYLRFTMRRLQKAEGRCLPAIVPPILIVSIEPIGQSAGLVHPISWPGLVSRQKAIENGDL